MRIEDEEIKVDISQFQIREYNSVIIGSGAAGLNCALHLIMEGIASEQVAIVTDNLGGGTSFNAGSDKQTYYKMSIIGDQLDSPHEMAKDLSAGGAMHGDIALIEATNSIREFFHLVQLGVPFPHDEFGGFVGYKTDNDPRQRATSIGPLTSQQMGKCLLKAVQDKNIKIFDKYHAVKILVDDNKDKTEAIGLICVNVGVLSEDKNIENVIESIEIFKVRNIIIATGGPALLYKNSVYPESQKGTTGLAIESGCKLQNLTESQFGLASIGYRWNVSGSYQQVIPRYFSIDEDNNEKEFLTDIFPSFKELSKAIFLKGYQWPFNAGKIEKYGSSLIDLAVYHEREALGRCVFLDFTKNPENYDFNKLDQLAKEYLTNSNVNGKNPFERLKKLNNQAVLLYKSHDIDLSSEPLGISVCNQHLNGGISCDKWWETTTVKNLFAIGEINGSHGIHRPGGAALNSGQVGGLRASQKIAHRYNNVKSINNDSYNSKAQNELSNLINEVYKTYTNIPSKEKEILTTRQLLSQLQHRMSKFGAIIRPLKDLDEEIEIIQDQLNRLAKIIILKKNIDVIDYLRLKDALLTQLLFLNSISNYHQLSGDSRGSYLILRDSLKESLSERQIIPPSTLSEYKFISSNNDLSNKIQTISLQKDEIKIEWEKVREIPSRFGWFENVWKDYLDENLYD
jgi:succinate dehydrogenase/fumarate reductase flavoprotein subunit